MQIPTDESSKTYNEDIGIVRDLFRFGVRLAFWGSFMFC